jgi:hypothetical protein
MMSDGIIMQKTDLAAKMVKTSPRGRNLSAAILVKKRNPVKNPRVMTRSFSLNSNQLIQDGRIQKFKTLPFGSWKDELIPLCNSDCKKDDLHDSSDHDEVGGEVMGRLKAFNENCCENCQNNTNQGK